VVGPFAPVGWSGREGDIDMAIEAGMEKAFGLDGDAWRRHANPWSV
jgi:hypothetical protein